MNTENLKKEIKKIKAGHVALLCAGIFLAFAIIGSILLAAGGGIYINRGQGIQWGSFFQNFGPGKTFDVNDRAELDMAGVNSMVISAVSDDVTLQSGSGKAVAELKGQCRSTTAPVRLDTRRDGGTVYIEVKYPAWFNNSSTNLTVTIPADYAGSLSITTVSGAIRCEGMPFKLGSVELHSVSGDIGFGTAAYSRMKAGTISGDVSISGIAAETAVNSISGEVDLDYAEAAATTVVNVSGGVSAAIPDAAAFSVDFGTVSGTFRSTHPGISVSSAGRGFESLKEGAVLIKVNTTSGDLLIEGK
jgi:hypothetical protein